MELLSFEEELAVDRLLARLRWIVVRWEGPEVTLVQWRKLQSDHKLCRALLATYELGGNAAAATFALSVLEPA